METDIVPHMLQVLWTYEVLQIQVLWCLRIFKSEPRPGPCGFGHPMHIRAHVGGSQLCLSLKKAANLFPLYITWLFCHIPHPDKLFHLLTARIVIGKLAKKLSKSEVWTHLIGLIHIQGTNPVNHNPYSSTCSSCCNIRCILCAVSSLCHSRKGWKPAL